MTTIMQPFQCDLQPQIQETHRTTHAGTTTRCRTQRRNQFADETTAAPPHTRGIPVIARRSHFTQKKNKVSCSGFLPKTKPMQHSCSHYNAFCSIPFTTTSLRHHFPSSPLPFVTTSQSHHFPSSPPCVIAKYSFVMYCYVMSSRTPPFINVNSFVMYC